MNQMADLLQVQTKAPSFLVPTDFGRPLSIAIINNMPDAVLRATEQQFCALLSAASIGLDVNLRFCSLPLVSRKDVAKAHIADYYESFVDLQDDPPDGMIVTGAEPRAAQLSDEQYWPAMRDLIDWTETRGISSVWSCLAAHAAVLRLDGIKRVPLVRKLSGVFDCQVDSASHMLANGLGRRWLVPHSRWNGLRRRELERCGYSIVSWSRQVGVDIFIRNQDSLQIFLQGHPEYDTQALALEYRRDIERAARTGGKSLPMPPKGYIVDGACRGAPGAITSLRPAAEWAAKSIRLFSNWLVYLDARRHPIERSAADDRVPAFPSAGIARFGDLIVDVERIARPAGHPPVHGS